MMARKRMLDPSIWSDDGMAELTVRQQLLYIGLISNADDEGRLKASPVAIRLMLPTVYALIKDGEIDGDLTAVLKRMRKLVPYIADGRRYLVFLNYRTWQKIDKPSGSVLPCPPSILPKPEEVAGTFDDRSTNDRIPFVPNRIEEKLTEEKRREHIAREPEPESDGFVEFFAAYPRHDAKVEAERAWRKLKPDARLRAMASLTVWKACEQWEQPRYVPQAATFLNQRRFDDTPPPRSPARASPNGHAPVLPRATLIDRSDVYLRNGKELSDAEKQRIEDIGNRARARREAEAANGA